VYAFYSLVHRSDGYLRGKRKRISLTFLSIRVSTCRCGDVGNHLRSSPLVSFRSKVVVVMRFFSHSSCLCSVSSLSLSFVYTHTLSLFLAEKNTKWYHIIPIRDTAQYIDLAFACNIAANRKKRGEEEEEEKKATARVAVYDMQYFQLFKLIKIEIRALVLIPLN
jgi:hypothetical protein